MEGPKAPSERRREAPERRGGGIFKFNVQIYSFSCYFCVKQYAESDDVLPLKYRVMNRYSVFPIFLVGIWQQNLAHAPPQEFHIDV